MLEQLGKENVHSKHYTTTVLANKTVIILFVEHLNTLNNCCIWIIAHNSHQHITCYLFFCLIKLWW